MERASQKKKKTTKVLQRQVQYCRHIWLLILKGVDKVRIYSKPHFRFINKIFIAKNRILGFLQGLGHRTEFKYLDKNEQF
jgi:hypothetical protein